MPTTGPSGRRSSAGRSRRAPGTTARDAARRPAERRRTTGTALPRDPAAPRARRSGLTTRAALLAGIVCLLLLALVVPLREFFAQRGRVQSMRAQVAEQEERVADLERRRRLLEDPAYVEQLARERLLFVRPGEVPYVVLAPEPRTTPTAGTAEADDRPWYEQLWSTVEGAAATPAPRPSPRPSR
jgi:cell division protein FtsB